MAVTSPRVVESSVRHPSRLSHPGPTTITRQLTPHAHATEGGFEADGQHLHHAVTTIKGIKVPGKAGQHLVSSPLHPSTTPLSPSSADAVVRTHAQGGANFPWGGGEHVVQNNYELLCWK